ncbi:MAG: hypothetical protein U0469_02775 [Candidatus Paceibacterota bacterium]
MKKILTILLSTLLIISFVGVKVKAATASKTTTPIKTTALLVATVDVYNATSTKIDADNYSVSFQIYNHEGIQSNIRYGLQLLDASTSAIIDTQLANEALTLGPQGSKNIQIKYTLPKFIISGKYKLMIVVKNQNGLPLAYMPAGFPERIITINNNYIAPTIDGCYLSIKDDASSTKYASEQGISISSNDILITNCKISNNGNNNLNNLKISLITHKRDQFGDIVSKNIIEQDISIKAKTSQDISFELPTNTNPQIYFVDTFLINSSQAKISLSNKIVYRVTGSSATIQNTILDKTEYKKGDIANLEVFWNGSNLSKNTIKATISDKNGNVCGSYSKSSSSTPVSIGKESLKINIERDCAGDVASVSIADEKGNILDSTKINLNNPVTDININPDVHTATTINGINKIYMFVFLIVLVLVGYGITSLKKRESMDN